MKYQIIQPPFTLKFREMSKEELKEYYQWFMAVMPNRIAQLGKIINATHKYEEWRADYTKESLCDLGNWFKEEVKTRERTVEELEKIEASLIFPIEINKEELTNKTFSLVIDIGMYFGQVMLHTVPETQWIHILKGSSKHIDYGQPVVRGIGKLAFNPVQIMLTAAYGIASKTPGKGNLLEIYNIWRNILLGLPFNTSLK